MGTALRLAVIAGVVLFAGEVAAQFVPGRTVTAIVPDGNYHPELDPTLNLPTYSGQSGPVVGVYGGNTSYTIATRFQGFQRLLTADGYVVQSFNQPFVPGCSANLASCAYFQALLQIETLVIANRRDPISAEEADILNGWLRGTLGCEGGCAPRRLFLSAGHEFLTSEPPFDYPAKIAELSARLGLTWPNGSLNPRTFALTVPENSSTQGNVVLHPIITGRVDAENTPSVVIPGLNSTAFTSSAPGAILTLPAGASDGPAGYAQGMALQLGMGRVYVSGDADMHTALIQSVIVDIFGFPYGFSIPFGMHSYGTPHNEQYLLNVMHWLDGLVADTDADAFADGVDNCVAKANGPAGSRQLDADLDGFGNACDGDLNNDGVVGAPDFGIFLNCFQRVPPAPGPADDPTCAESDMNGDGIVTPSDFSQLFVPLYGHPPGPSGLACANASAPAAPCFVSFGDADGDGVLNVEDSCVQVENPSQLDADFDGFGNACDGDLNNDGFVLPSDYEAFNACFSQSAPSPGPLHDLVCTESDMDGNGIVDEADFDLWVVAFTTTGLPGPSGKACADATSRLKPCETPIDTGNQRPDPNYNPVLASPEYASESGPRVAFDSAHANFQTISHLSQGFYKLLTADGYDVHDFGVPFVAGCSSDLANCTYFQALKQFNTFVIASPTTPITGQEAAVITGWLRGELGCESGCAPRRLFLIGDHNQDFSITENIAPLTLLLGLNWPSSSVSERTFTPAGPNLLDSGHVIVQGRPGLGEGVVSVKTFLGTGFTRPGTVSLLTVPPSEGGRSQGMAFAFGTGRVYVSGEAAMFTAQTAGSGPTGMHSLPFNQNQQFLLNILHWLDGLLDPQ